MATFTGTNLGDSITPALISAGVSILGAPGDLSANDFLNGLGGSDTLNGGAGNDQISGGLDADTLIGGTGDDTLSGDDGGDSMDGGDGNDVFQGVGLGDRAFGGVGNDIFNLFGQAGVLVLDGGAGVDTLNAFGTDISGTAISGVENLGGGATLTGAQLAGFTRVGTDSPAGASFYSFSFVGPTVADFSGKIADARDVYTIGVSGLVANASLLFGATTLARASITGGAGNDTIRGGANRDTLSGGQGADSISGGNGDDRIDAGSYDNAADTLRGGAGSDRIFSVGLSDAVFGDDGDDFISLSGEGAPVTISGGGGTDTLNAANVNISGSVITGVENLAGSATLTGAQLAAFTRVGTDTPASAGFYYFTFTDTTVAASFAGKIADARDTYYLYADAAGSRIALGAAELARAYIQGGAGADGLAGGAANDTINGGAGADSLTGGGGDDQIDAGYYDGAADTIRAGAGADWLRYVGAGDSAFGEDGDDYIQLSGEGAPATISGGGGTDTLDAQNSDISGAVITGVENLAGSATLTGAQLAALTRVGTDTPTFGGTYYFTFTDTTVAASFAGKIADARDTYYLYADAAGSRISLGATELAEAYLQGGAAADVLAGGAANDTINGGAGADSLTGGAGDDQIDAGYFDGAADTIRAGAGADRITWVGAGDSVFGEDGDDFISLSGEGAPAVISGGGGTDTLVATVNDISGAAITGVENLAGGATLTAAQANAFLLFGTSGPGSAQSHSLVLTTGGSVDFSGRFADPLDTFYVTGSSSADTLLAGVADVNDVDFRGADGADSLRGGAGDDTLYGNADNDTLDGGAGSDSLYGGAGSDSLAGGDGNDVIEAGYFDGVADTVRGGAGGDSFIYVGAGDAVFGDDGDDLITLSGEGAPATISGGAGFDTLEAGSVNISASAITGVEVLAGSATLTAAQANAFLLFGTSNPGDPNSYSLTLTTGGTVNFAGRFAESFDSFFVTGTTGADSLWAGAADLSNVSFTGAAGNDSLLGGAGDDTLSGDAGADTLDGGLGVNVLNGGADRDTVSYASFGGAVTLALNVAAPAFFSDTRIDTLTGIESIIGSAFSDSLTGSALGNTLSGGDGSDTLSGLSGFDLLDGGEGTDSLLGGDGNDTLTGGAGNDTLIGGAGVDRFLFAPDGGADLVTDFADTIDVVAFSGFGPAFDTAAEVLAVSSAVGGGVFINLGTTTVQIDALALANFTAADMLFL